MFTLPAPPALLEDNRLTPDGLVIAGFVVSIIFVMIGHEYREFIQQRLKGSLVHIEAFDLDWWSVIHFALFAYFGFVKPNYPLTFFLAGCAFEVFEDSLASDATTKLMECTRKDVKNSTLGKIHCNGYKDSYWYGKVDDVMVNLIGYVTGQAVRLCMFST